MHLNFKNAEVARRAPDLARWATWCCGRPTPPFKIWSTRGVQQRDPLGPTLSFFGIQPAVEEQRPLLHWEGFFPDVGHLIGTERQMSEAHDHTVPRV